MKTERCKLLSMNGLDVVDSHSKGFPLFCSIGEGGSLWYTAVEAIVEASRQINIMILCFVSAEQTAHTSYFPKTGPFSTITSDNIKDN